MSANSIIQITGRSQSFIKSFFYKKSIIGVDEVGELFKYDISTNSVTQINQRSPRGFKIPRKCNLILNCDSNKLYCIDSMSIWIFNLRDMKWTKCYGFDDLINYSNAINYGLIRYQSTYSITFGDVMHIFDGRSHVIFDVNEKSCDIFGHRPTYLLGQCFYVKSLNKILSFAENKIFDGVFHSNYKEIKWSNNVEMKLPFAVYNIQKIFEIYQGLLMFVVCKQFWVYDIKDNSWFKNDVICNESQIWTTTFAADITNMDIINTNDNYIHFILYNQFHFKIHVMDLIASGMTQNYKKNEGNKLIFGFVSKTQNDYNISYNVPLCIKELILLYYAPFVYT